jgi:hypothetical protein
MASSVLLITLGRLVRQHTNRGLRRYIPDMTAKRDFTGVKSHHLTFVRPTTLKARYVIWEVQCDCGKVFLDSPTRIMDRPSKPGKKSCGCMREAAYKAAAQKTRRYDPVISSARMRWKRSYPDAKWETYYSLSRQYCHYCGSPPRLTWNKSDSYKSNPSGRRKRFSAVQIENGNFTHNGLDRIDSSKGHTDDNCVPCCYICNSMKSDMPYEEFRNHIKQVYAHLFQSDVSDSGSSRSNAC